MRAILLVTFIVPFLLTSLFAQTLSKKDLIIDLIYMDSLLRYGHPSNLAFPNDLDFSPKIKEVTVNLPDTLTKNQYANAVREVLMEVKCSHTAYAGWSQKKSKKVVVEEKYFPNYVFTDGEKVWVNHEVNDSLPTNLNFGDEIISINGNKMDSILRILMNYHTDDGNGRQVNKYMVNNLFPLSLTACIPNDSLFSVVTKDKLGIEKTTTVEASLFKRKEEVDAESIIQGNKSYFSLINDSLGYIRIKSIQGKERTFYKKVFQTIADSNVQTLVLDLRNNPGGNLFSCIDFLGYIITDTSQFTLTFPENNMRQFLKWKNRRAITRWNFLLGILKAESKEKTPEGKVYTVLIKPKPELAYKGKLYVLTSELTTSGASMISSYARHHRESTLIGQTTGGGEYFLNSALGPYPIFELPQSKLLVQTATHHMRYDGQAAHFNGITPDILIEYDATTFGKRDLEMEKVFELKSK